MNKPSTGFLAALSMIVLTALLALPSLAAVGGGGVINVGGGIGSISVSNVINATGGTNIIDITDFPMNTWLTNASGSNLYVFYGVTAATVISTNGQVSLHVDLTRDGTWDSTMIASSPSNTVSHSVQLLVSGAVAPGARYTITNLTTPVTPMVTTTGGVMRVYAPASSTFNGNVTNTVITATTFTTLPHEVGTTYYVTTNGSDSADGLTTNTAFANPYKASSVAQAADLIRLGPGTFTIGSNLVILREGVNLKGAGKYVTLVKGTADCAGMNSQGVPTGGTQFNLKGNNTIEDLEIQCDTNSLWTTELIGTIGAKHTGAWAGLGICYLNSPTSYGGTNITIRNVAVTRGYFVGINFEITNRVNVLMDNVTVEQDGGDCLSTVAPAMTLNSEQSWLTCRNCTFRSEADPLYDAYVNSLNPHASGGSGSVYMGSSRALFESCNAVVVNTAFLPGPELVILTTTNRVSFAGGSWTGAAGSFYGGVLQGWTYWNGSNVTSVSMSGQVTNIFSGSASLDFPSTGAGTNSSLTITVTGATTNGAVLLSIPNNVVGLGGFFIPVATNDAVRIYFYNTRTNFVAVDPPAGQFRVRDFE